MRSPSVALRAPLSAAALIFAFSLPAAAGSSPAGVWLDHTGRGAVEIKPCGAALCGHVVWVKSTSDSKGCGRQIIGDARASGGNGAHEGWIYSPEDKKRFNVELTPMRDGRLRVVGYKGIKLFSRTMMWTRADANLTRCGTENATAPAQPPALAKAAPVAPPAAPPPVATAASSAPPEQAEVKVQTQELPSATGGTTPASEAADSVRKQPALDGVEQPEGRAPEAKQAVPAPQPQSAGSASAEDDVSGSESAGTGSGKIDLGKIDLDQLGLDKVLTRTAGGNCKLDLPWVKVEFGCARQ